SRLCGRLARSCLLEREAQQLRALLLLEEGRRDAALVARPSYAVGAVGRHLGSLERAITENLPAQRGHLAFARHARSQMNPPAGLSLHRFQPHHGLSSMRWPPAWPRSAHSAARAPRASCAGARCRRRCTPTRPRPRTRPAPTRLGRGGEPAPARLAAWP